MTNIRDVAKRAKVSIATVSRVLNNSELVSNKVRYQVELAIENLNYQRPTKKQPKAKGLLAIILPDLVNPFFINLLDNLEKEAYQHGKSLLLFNSRHDRHLEKVYLEECQRHKVDGVFLVPLRTQDNYMQALQKLPFVVLLITQTSPYLSCIAVDHFEGGKMAAQFLARKYHKIGYVGVINEQEEKLAGFIKGLEEQNIKIDSKLFIDIKTSKLPVFLQQDLSEVAFFCMNDVTAEKFILALKEQKIVCPFIIGFDNSSLAKVHQFSSIAQPIKQMANIAFKQMIIQINQVNYEINKILLKPHLTDMNTILD